MPVVFWIVLVQPSCHPLLGVVYYSEPVRTSAWAAYDPVCCFFAVAQMGSGGQTSRGILRGSRRAFKFTRMCTYAVVACMMLFTQDVSLHLPVQTHVSNTVCHWVQHLAFGMCTFYYPRCAIVSSCSNLLKLVCYTFEIYYSVRKESDEISLFREGPCETWFGMFRLTFRWMPDFTRLSCTHGVA